MNEPLKKLVKENDILTFFNEHTILEFEKKRGNEYYFKKHNQVTGSISVNPSKNFFYDHQEQKGGNIHKAIEMFYTGCYVEFNKIDVVKAPDYVFEVTKVERLKHFGLINYFKDERKIDTKFLNLVSEIHYNRINSETGEIKSFFTGGIADDNGTYHTRNKFAKFIIGSNITVTTFNESSNICNVFESFIDYLSFLTHTNKTEEASVVLNGIGNVKKANLSKYKEINLFLDNGIGGLKVTKEIQEEFPLAKNKIFYGPGEDYNSWLVESLKVKSLKL